MSDNLLHPKNRYELSKPFVRIFFEVLIFGILGLLLGIFVSYFFQNFSPQEPIWETLFYLFFQFIIAAIIIFCLDSAYEKIFNTDSDEYIGIIIFSNIFFLTQVQLSARVLQIYNKFLGNPTIVPASN